MVIRNEAVEFQIISQSHSHGFDSYTANLYEKSQATLDQKVVGFFLVSASFLRQGMLRRWIGK
jgi:hypothetical protein